MKLKYISICPVCGANEEYIYTNNSGPYEGRTFCAICGGEIIPLVTPQEKE